jgi:hypothetical protein
MEIFNNFLAIFILFISKTKRPVLITYFYLQSLITFFFCYFKNTLYCKGVKILSRFKNLKKSSEIENYCYKTNFCGK